MSPKTRQREKEKKLAKRVTQREASQRLDTLTDDTDVDEVTIGNRQNPEQSTSQTPVIGPGLKQICFPTGIRKQLTWILLR